MISTPHPPVDVPRRPPAPTAVARPRLTVFGCEPDEAQRFAAAADRRDLDVRILTTPVHLADPALAASRCISVGHRTPLPGPVLAALHAAGVRYVSSRSIGCDHIDLVTAARLGIAVEGVEYAPDGVADYTLMLMLMALRGARSTVQRVDRGDFRVDGERGRELRDLTVGVIGTGRIGAAVVRRLTGFGCTVLAHGRRPVDAASAELDGLLAASDVVSLHVPLAAETRHLLSAERIERMRPGAIVVNTGRGALIDTVALLAALETGRLAAAALDVVEGEEGVFYADHRRRGDDDSPLARLQRLPNVLITPHTAFHTDRALDDVVERTLDGCLRFDRIPA